MFKELQVFADYESLATLDDLFAARAKVEDALKQLKDIRKEFDGELLRRMKEKKIREFRSGVKGNEFLIRAENEKKVLINCELMKACLNKSGPIREMAFNALAGSQAAWKDSKVKLMADTLGIPDLIKISYGDKIEVQIIPVDKLEAMGKIQK